MKINWINGGVCAAKGFTASGIHCGIRKNKNKLDLAMILSSSDCNSAAVYTQNKVKGAPLIITRQHLDKGKIRGVLCNSGNANTCNPGGVELAADCCALAAKATGLHAHQFAIASTGVIGQPLPLDPFVTGLPKLAKILTQNGSAIAAEAIMTTDTRPKEFAIEFYLGETRCHIGAIAKGSGMINPNMATMLVFITTDVNISTSMLQKALTMQTENCLNQICVDGDTSTNDMALIMANGQAGNVQITTENQDYHTFCQIMDTIGCAIAQAIAADGEGATKLLACSVNGAPTKEIARKISKQVISSNLVKSAIFGEDANWGRVLCAIGYTPGDFDVSKIDLTFKSRLGEVNVCANGAYSPFNEELAAKVLSDEEIHLLINLNDGESFASAWGCDLTLDYVKINADYRS